MSWASPTKPRNPIVVQDHVLAQIRAKVRDQERNIFTNMPCYDD